MLKIFFPIMIGLMVVLLVACSESKSEPTSGGDGDMNNDEQTQSNESNSDPQYNVVSFIEQLTFNANVKASESQVNIQFSLTNDADEAAILGFNSSQLYEITIVNEAGDTVYKYSDGQAFAQALTTKELQPGEVLEAKEQVKQRLENGQYEARMTFLVTTINDQPLESYPFQMTKSFAVGEDVEAKNSPESGQKPKTKTSPHTGQSTDIGKEVFRNFTLDGEKGNYSISGEASVNEGTFYYSVDNGHNILIDKKRVQVEKAAPEWSSFDIQIDIPKEKLPDKGALVMTIYQLDENGQPVNMNYVPLENFGSNG
ncbi:BsuPI-related putative proteinase inhibitor [Halobacillus amylolyticus]|uniref:Intracellular proteinase inhibitor BsuPI domain-containing protein n=1 Tax=Halobacillus amylolyticus TaxID=2932259 RepID=A0ABY4HFJ9_9BACI|nr:BsuPI-related putative proteinase inhibitor [Halobacillus amylolyticus]UOR13153.1 BsuPI-related putative proteinase inhibitor [Halobacillus amylolyticus]